MKDCELLEVKAFYYQKALEEGVEKANTYIQYWDKLDQVWEDVPEYSRFSEPSWDVSLVWRIRPIQVEHKGGIIPRGLTRKELEAMPSDASVYIPVIYKTLACNYTVCETLSYRLLEVMYGMVHRTEEDAIRHAKVMYQIGDDE
jgi:hypothetical protein